MSNEYDAYVNLLNSQPENIRKIETLTLSHSLFSKTYYLVFDNVEFTANAPAGNSVTFSPFNATATNAANSNDLDQVAAFTISDLDNTLDDELDNIPLGDTEDIIALYAIYTTEYDDPADYVEYIVNEIPQKNGTFTVNCGAPSLNRDETGETFDYDRFPALRGL